MEEHAKKRSAWAKQYCDRTYTKWSKAIWGDESLTKVGKAQRSAWVFHLDQFGGNWKRDYILGVSVARVLKISREALGADHFN